MAGIGTAGKIVAIAIVCILVGTGIGYFVTLKTVKPTTVNDTNTTPNPVIMAPPASGDCSWKNIQGQGWDPQASDLITVCGKATGKVVMITMYVENEADRYHFTIQPDAQYTYLMNGQNNLTMKQHGLDGTLMCEIPLGQVAIMPKLHVGQHLEVQGPWIKDKENLWNEIHFVQSIKEVA